MNLNDLKNAIEKHYPNANNGICLGSNVDFMLDTSLFRTPQCGNYGNLLSLFFAENFVKLNNCFTKQVSVRDVSL